MGRRGYSAEFRRKVLDLLAEKRSVAVVAHDLDLGDQTIYNWRRQDRIDRGPQPGLSTAENAKLTAVKRRISELETELAISRRAAELPKEEPSPKGGTRPSKCGRGEPSGSGRTPGLGRLGVRLLRAPHQGAV